MNKNRSFTIFLGFLIIIFLLWNRLLRIRFPKTLDQELDNMNVIKFIIFIFTFSFIMLLVTIHKIRFQNKPNQNNLNFDKLYDNFYIKMLITTITQIIYAPRITFDWLYERIEILSYIDFISIVCYNQQYLNYVKRYYLILNLPKIIVSMIFVLDIIFYNEFTLFYKSLALLTIPLLGHSLIYILQFSTANAITYIENYIEIVKDEISGQLSFSIKDSTKEINFDYCVERWIVYDYLFGLLQAINEYQDKYKNIINLFYYINLSIGWLYYLWFVYYDYFIVILENLVNYVDIVEPFSGLNL